MRTYVRGGMCSSVPVQDVVAPFALENLGCSGNETRLVDCPVAVPPAEGDYSFYDYGQAVCDPYRGTFARVACGSSQDAGASMPIEISLGAMFA